MKINPEWFKFKAPKYAIDCETISRAALTAKEGKKVGSYGGARYWEDPSTIISMICLKDLETNENHVWYNPDIWGDRGNLASGYCAYDITGRGFSFVAHNVMFDGKVLNKEFYVYEDFKPENTIMNGHCTSELATINGYPASLEGCAEAFGIEGKFDVGKAMNQIACKYYDLPAQAEAAIRKLQKFIPELKVEIKELEHGYILCGEDLRKIIEKYCRQDVEICAQLWEKFNPKDNKIHTDEANMHNFWISRITRLMNLNGTHIDIPLVENLAKLFDEYKIDADEKVAELTGGLKATQAAKLKEWVNPYLEERSIKNEGLGANKINEYLEKLEPNDSFRATLQVLADSKDTSGHKMKTILATHVGGKIYDYMVCRGATNTGRHSARTVQLQNFPRPMNDIKASEMLGLCKEVKLGLENEIPLKYYFRPTLIPGKEELFYDTDWSQIEPRMALYKTKQFDALEEMVKGDLYIKFAKSIWPDKDIKKGDIERDIAKKAFMALMYGRSASALKMQLAGDETYIELELAEKIHSNFHQMFPAFKKHWYQLEKEAKKSVIHGQYSNRLLSGRCLVYRKLRSTREGLTYQGLFQGKFVTKELYGSKLFGHDIQAECGDFMNMGINYFIQETQLLPNFMVHDQIIVSCPKDTRKEDLDKIWGECGNKVVNQFYPGLPVDFESELCYFFYK